MPRTKILRSRSTPTTSSAHQSLYIACGGATRGCVSIRSRQPSINRSWLETLTLTATSATGLQIVPEPSEPEPSESK